MSAWLRGVVLAALTAGQFLAAPFATAAGQGACDGGGNTGGDSITVSVECTSDGSAAAYQSASSDGAQSGSAKYDAYQWWSPCVQFDGNQASELIDCGLARTCPEPGELLWNLWGQLSSTGSWVLITSQCFGETPEAPNVPLPRVTPALVLREIERIGLPTLQAMTQPEGRTLVNFDTIFYTEAQPFTASVTLLGRTVDIVAEPTAYTWHLGDGTTTTTSTPGAPYPSREITYRYSDARTTVRPRVDVTYSARFRVNGGAWQDIDETVTVAGPEGSLRVSEARGSLSGNYG